MSQTYSNISYFTYPDPGYPDPGIIYPPPMPKNDKKKAGSKGAEANGENPVDEDIDTSKLEIKFVDQT